MEDNNTLKKITDYPEIQNLLNLGMQNKSVSIDEINANLPADCIERIDEVFSLLQNNKIEIQEEDTSNIAQGQENGDKKIEDEKKRIISGNASLVDDPIRSDRQGSGEHLCRVPGQRLRRAQDQHLRFLPCQRSPQASQGFHLHQRLGRRLC